MRAGFRSVDAALKAAARSGFSAAGKPGSNRSFSSLWRTLVPYKPVSAAGNTGNCVEAPGHQSAGRPRSPTSADGSEDYDLLRANRSTRSRNRILSKAMATEQGKPVKGSCFTKTAEMNLKAGILPQPEYAPKFCRGIPWGSGSLGLSASQRVALQYRCSQYSGRNLKTRESAALLPLVGQSAGGRVLNDLRIGDGDILA